MATSAKSRSSLWFVVMLVVVVYALTSAGVAVATQNKCGAMQSAKTWQIFPPGWECSTGRLPGQS